MQHDPHSIFSVLEVCARVDLPMTKRSIIAELGRMASLDGNLSSFASQERIAFFLGLGVSTVRQHMKELEAMGLIRRERRYNEAGHRKTDLTFLVWEGLLKAQKTLPPDFNGRESLPPDDEALPPDDGIPTASLLAVIKNSPDKNYPDKNSPDVCVGKRGRRRSIPDDFPTEENIQKAIKSTSLTEDQIRHETTRFRDSAEAHARIYADWDAAFRNWLNSPYQSQSKQKAGGQRPRRNFREDGFAGAAQRKYQRQDRDPVAHGERQNFQEIDN